MGVRLNSKVHMIPAKLENGILMFKVGSREFSQDIPALKGKSAPLQCNFVENDYVRAYLVNKDLNEVYLLRTNCSGTIFNATTKSLFKHFTYEWDIKVETKMEYFETAESIYGGLLERVDGGRANYEMCTIQRITLTDYLLSFEGMPVVLTFSESDESNYLLHLSSCISEYPIFWLDGDILQVSDGKGKIIYTFNTKVIRGNGYIYL